MGRSAVLGRLARLGLAAAVAWSLSGCGVVFDAPKVSVLVRDDGIVFAGAEDRQELTGGETVVKILNDSNQERQIVLARLGDLPSVPPALHAAESAREDDRILGMTHVMDPKEADFASGGLGYDIDEAAFHLYLAPGERYVLFDRLGGLDDGVVMEIVPGGAA